MNKFDLILKKFAEAIAQGGDRDDVEAQVLAFAKRQGYGDFNSIEELERAGMEGIERDLDASETRLGNVGRSLAQGLTMGFSDELAGLGAALAPGGRDYQEGRQEALARLERGRRENPYASFAGEMAGAVAPGIGAMRAASMIPQVGRALRSPRLMPRLRTGGLPQPGRAAAMAGLGAAEGAVYGLGAGESGLQDRLESAETGAKFGGAIGGALPFVPLVGGALRTRGARGGDIRQTVQEGIERLRPRDASFGPARIERRSPRGLLDSADTQLANVGRRRVQAADQAEGGFEAAQKNYDDFATSHRLGWEDADGLTQGGSNNVKLVEWLRRNMFGDNQSKSGIGTDSQLSKVLGDDWKNDPQLVQAVRNIRESLEEGITRTQKALPQDADDIRFGIEQTFRNETSFNPNQVKNLSFKDVDQLRKNITRLEGQGLGDTRTKNTFTQLLDNLYGEKGVALRTAYSRSNQLRQAYNAGAGIEFQQMNSSLPKSNLFKGKNPFSTQGLEMARKQLRQDPRFKNLTAEQRAVRLKEVDARFLDGIWDRFSKELEGSFKEGGEKAGIAKLYNLTRGEGRGWLRQFFEEGRSGDRKFKQALTIIEEATPFNVKHRNLYNFMRVAAIFGLARGAFASGESGLLGAIDPF